MEPHIQVVKPEKSATAPAAPAPVIATAPAAPTASVSAADEKDGSHLSVDYDDKDPPWAHEDDAIANYANDFDGRRHVWQCVAAKNSYHDVEGKGPTWCVGSCMHCGRCVQFYRLGESERWHLDGRRRHLWNDRIFPEKRKIPLVTTR